MCMCVVFFSYIYIYIYIYLYIYIADLSIIHCLNVVRCIIIYLKYIIIIMKFQKKYLFESSFIKVIKP